MSLKPGASRPVSTRARGSTVERAVARFLEARGLEICERNVHVGGAEIDLIAQQAPQGPNSPPTVIFVEVRSRADTRRGTPLETVGARKRARLLRAASAWLVARDLWERVAVRFDVVGVVVGDGDAELDLEDITDQSGRNNDEAPRIQWIPGAFDGDG